MHQIYVGKHEEQIRFFPLIIEFKACFSCLKEPLNEEEMTPDKVQCAALTGRFMISQFPHKDSTNYDINNTWSLLRAPQHFFKYHHSCPLVRLFYGQMH